MKTANTTILLLFILLIFLLYPCSSAAITPNGIINLINGDFDQDQVINSNSNPVNSYMSIIPTGWQSSGASGLIVVDASLDTTWGGGTNPSGRNYLAVESKVVIKRLWQTISISARTTVNVTYYARTRPTAIVYQYTGVVIYFGSTLVAYQSLTDTWQKYTATINALPSVVTDKLTVTGWYQTCSTQDCTFEIDKIVMSFTCNPGSYAPAGASGCTLCEAGKYATSIGQKICNSCVSGYYNSNVGSTNISACIIIPQGYYANSAANIIPCLAGTFNNKTGSTTISDCKQCPINTYSSLAAAICTSCPPGFQSKSGSSQCATPSSQPTQRPSHQPTTQPTSHPTKQPIRYPSVQPTNQPIRFPSKMPTVQPTFQPILSPSLQPFLKPQAKPTCQPITQPSNQPSEQPSRQPSKQPSRYPTSQPKSKPSSQPYTRPSPSPSKQPSSQPIKSKPSSQPYSKPTEQPTKQPIRQPTKQPSHQPISHPSSIPSTQPTCQPSRQPSVSPSTQPSLQPLAHPSNQPRRSPSIQPVSNPSEQPTNQPIHVPSITPSCQPSPIPSNQPDRKPQSHPSSQPSAQPSSQPSSQPSTQPSNQPHKTPSRHPTKQPITKPSSQPYSRPSGQPSQQPTRSPTQQQHMFPSTRPSLQPLSVPSIRPKRSISKQPITTPSGQPVIISYSPIVVTISPSKQPSFLASQITTIKPQFSPTSSPAPSQVVVVLVQPTITPSIIPIVVSSQPSTSNSTNQPVGVNVESSSSSITLSFSNILVVSFVSFGGIFVVVLLVLYRNGYLELNKNENKTNKKKTTDELLTPVNITTDEIYDMMSYENMLSPEDTTIPIEYIYSERLVEQHQNILNTTMSSDGFFYALDNISNSFQYRSPEIINNDNFICLNSSETLPSGIINILSNKSSIMKLDDEFGNIDDMYNNNDINNDNNVEPNYFKNCQHSKQSSLNLDDIVVCNLDKLFDNVENKSVNNSSFTSSANISMQNIYEGSENAEFQCRNPLRVGIDADHVAYF